MMNSVRKYIFYFDVSLYASALWRFCKIMIRNIPLNLQQHLLLYIHSASMIMTNNENVRTGISAIMLFVGILMVDLHGSFLEEKKGKEAYTHTLHNTISNVMNAGFFYTIFKYYYIWLMFICILRAPSTDKYLIYIHVVWINNWWQHINVSKRKNAST